MQKAHIARVSGDYVASAAQYSTDCCNNLQDARQLVPTEPQLSRHGAHLAGHVCTSSSCVVS